MAWRNADTVACKEVKTLAAGTYFGCVVRRVEAPGVILSEIMHSDRRQFPAHTHTSATITLFLAGSYVERIGSHSLEWSPLSASVRPPQVTHSDAINTRGSRMFTIDLADGWWDEFSQFEEPRSFPVGAVSGEVLPALLRAYLRFVNGSAEALNLGQLIWEVLPSVARMAHVAERGRPRWLAHAVSIAHERFAEPLTIGGVAAEVGVHPVHFSREFRRRKGCTFGEYVNRVRLTVACKSLQDDALRLAEIAHAMGFADQSHFARTLRRVIGVTPGQLRQTLQSF
jgi:AraC family transcriptional regulator